MTKLIILDRDGVINEDSDLYIRSADEWFPIPGSIEAIARLSLAGYQVVIATNQSGISRGYFSLSELNTMHDKLSTLVREQGGDISGIYYCPHGPDENCQCRKPKPGLIDHIFADIDAVPADTWVIGDSLRDLQAGQNSGCRVALVLTGKGVNTQAKLIEHPEVLSGARDVPVYNNLKSFVEELLSEGI